MTPRAAAVGLLLLSLACGEKRPRTFAWEVAPEDVPPAKWAGICGTEYVSVVHEPHHLDPRPGMTERWRGHARLYCSRRWSWDTTKDPVVRRIAEQTIWGWNRDEFVRAVDDLLVPMLPLEVRAHLRTVALRDYTPFPVEVHGFAIGGGYKASDKAWFVSIRRADE